jgi:hypothetical protein
VRRIEERFMNAITRHEGGSLIGFDDIQRMADVFASSKLFGIQTPEQYMTLMFLAQSEGQHPATVAQDYDIIQGRAGPQDAQRARALPGFRWIGAVARLHRESRFPARFTHPKGGSLKGRVDDGDGDQGRSRGQGQLEEDAARHAPRPLHRRGRARNLSGRTRWSTDR